MKDELGDRMKTYEAVGAQKRLDRAKPMVARLDGRGFSKFTKGFQKPFDYRLTAAMDQATKALVDMSHAEIGYTQSDEITLIWQGQDNHMSGGFFDWREQKLCSVLASKCTVEFVFALMEQLTLGGDSVPKSIVQAKKPHFDCRIWNVPTLGEAANTLLWRAQDARKNAVSVYARQHISHKSMQGLNQQDMLQAASAAGGHATTRDDIAEPGEVYGRMFSRVTRERTLTDEEWQSIPEDKRPVRDVVFTRSAVEQVLPGYFGDVGDQQKRIEAIFGETDVH